LPVTNNRKRTDLPFDSIVTMYAWARPADWNVQEFRYGVPDASITDIDLTRLREAVEFAYSRWKSGDRVLIRCQAGLNRSGLVTALLLIKDGHSPESAITMIRTGRGEDGLFNTSFTDWLIAEAETFFNTSPSQQAA
jgi:protein-tyrosine phosphatase